MEDDIAKINERNYSLEEKLQLVGRAYENDKKIIKRDLYIRNTCNRKHQLYEPNVINKHKIILKKGPGLHEDQKHLHEPGTTIIKKVRVQKKEFQHTQNEHGTKFWTWQYEKNN